MSRIKNVNTNTNINRININVPRQYRRRQPKKKTVAQAEESLSQDENQDRQASYQPQNISINPNVYGFNTSPINREVGIPETRPEMRTQINQTETQTKGRTMATQTRNIREQTAKREAEIRGISSEMGEMGTDPMEESISSVFPVAKAISFRSTSVPVDKGTLALQYSAPEFSFNRPSDFQNRLSRQEGFQPQSSYAPLYQNRMRDILKQGRPDLDINMMARNTKEAYRGETQMIPFAEQTGGGSVKDKIQSIEQTQTTPVYPKAFEEGLPPAKKGKGGRPLGSKNKPKPQKTEMITQTGESLNPREPIATQTTPRPKKALRGRKIINMEEID